MLFAKSTYSYFINSVIAEFGDDPRVAKITPSQFIQWVLQAEDAICRQMDVKEEYSLRYLANINEYKMQDRPPITGVTAASPAVLSSTGHGLNLNDVFVVFGVQGMDIVSGRMQAKAVTANSITLQHYLRIINATNATPIVLQFDEDHPFKTGDTPTIADVAGNDAANGTFTVTYVNSRMISLDTSVGNGNYSGGGTAIKDVDATGLTYVAGGRLWQENEIPTYFQRFLYGTLIFGNDQYTVDVVGEKEVNQTRSRFELSYPYLYQYPIKMGMTRKNGTKYLAMFPTPIVDNNLALHGVLDVTPKDYTRDPEGTTIHLSSEFDEAIIAFVKGKAAQAGLKDFNLAASFRAEFKEYLSEVIGQIQPTNIDVVYR